jgi:hypothetical protein
MSTKKTIKVKTADLVGRELNWAVTNVVEGDYDFKTYHPSVDWSHGGPVIERLLKTGQWEIVQGVRAGEVMVQNYNAECLPVDGESYDQPSMCFSSDSLLIAVCRATVAAKYGDTLHVPAYWSTINFLHTVKGVQGTTTQLAEHFGVVRPKIALDRIARRGWSVERAVTEPPNEKMARPKL